MVKGNCLCRTLTDSLFSLTYVQIQTNLSDKTGTLTRKPMAFFKRSIAGVSYSNGIFPCKPHFLINFSLTFSPRFYRFKPFFLTRPAR